MELLIIILIIGLLIGIILPSIDRAYRAVRINTTLSQFNLLSTACELYRQDFDEYPISRQHQTGDAYFEDNDVQYGKTLIVLLLTGYGPDTNPLGTPGTIMQIDDGKSGFGFRTVTRGRVYGPYNGAENVSTTYEDQNGNGQQDDDEPTLFADAFGRAILYYQATDGIFDHEDNDDAPAPDEDYIEQFDNTGRGFLFLSPGPNGEWDTSDDLSSD